MLIARLKTKYFTATLILISGALYTAMSVVYWIHSSAQGKKTRKLTRKESFISLDFHALSTFQDRKSPLRVVSHPLPLRRETTAFIDNSVTRLSACTLLYICEGHVTSRCSQWNVQVGPGGCYFCPHSNFPVEKWAVNGLKISFHLSCWCVLVLAGRLESHTVDIPKVNYPHFWKKISLQATE